MILKTQDGTFDLDNVFLINIQDHNYVILLQNQFDNDFDSENDCLPWYYQYEREYLNTINETQVEKLINAISDDFVEISGNMCGRSFINCKFYHGTYTTSQYDYNGNVRYDIRVRLYGPGDVWANEYDIKTEEDFNRKLIKVQRICEKVNKNKDIVEL